MNISDVKSRLKLSKVLLLGTLFLPAIISCTDNAPYVNDAESETEETVSLDAGNSETTTEDEVVLFGYFSEHLGGSLFLIEETGTADPSQVLVVNDSTYGFKLPSNESIPLWAIGEVRPLDLADIENVEPETLEMYEGEPAIYSNPI